MERKLSGYYVVSTVASEQVKAFVPSPLPPEDFKVSSRLHKLNEQANRALGRLDMAGSQLHDIFLFIYFYQRKEALISSQIEGTQSSFADLLMYENKDSRVVPTEDVKEVSNYVAAIDFGLKRIKDDDFPVSVRLIKELHQILLRTGRGESKSPGEFRRSQNWIGGTRPGNARFVPPPPDMVVQCMSEWEKFIHDESEYIPFLIKIGMAHVQFETIHPFLDGNGRIGRLLIPLLLCANKVIQEPMLSPSLYFKTHRDEYYEHLQNVRLTGDWEKWLSFFLTCISETATQAAETTFRLLKLFEFHRETIKTSGRMAGTVLRVHEHLQRSPIDRISNISRQTGLTYPAVKKAVDKLVELGVVKKSGKAVGKKRNMYFIYDAYINILDEGTEPLG